APGSVAVAAFYLVCYQAKKFKTRYYIARYMFNTPPGIAPWADLAKMLAKQELVAKLEDEHFQIFTQIRGRIAHFASNLDMAKGQLGVTQPWGFFEALHRICGWFFGRGTSCETSGSWGRVLKL
ncbi:MAG: hypothetical protein N2Z84_03455, partial [Atribacterota bacterium]|nr:hypothetical protein [Atribacterota bacterium]